MAVPLTLPQRIQRKLPRTLKFTRQWLRVASQGRPSTRAVFVVGSQRSGTRLPLQLFDRSEQVMTYSEGHYPYFDGVMLQPLPTVERLLARNPFPLVVLKPICETHRVVELLQRFPGSRAVWIFRHYRDAVNSASLKWKSGKESVRRLAVGDLERAAWRAGGLTPEKFETVRAVYNDDLTLHAANAIMWYLRNDLFFDLGVAARDDVMLVRYEDLVQQPRAVCERMFRFTGADVPDGLAESVYTSSVSKKPFPPIPAEIEALCQMVERKLLAHYAGSVEPQRSSGDRAPIADVPAGR